MPAPTKPAVPAMNPLAPLARMRAAMQRAQLQKKLALRKALSNTVAKRKAGQSPAVPEEKKGMSTVAKAGIGASILAVLAGIIGVKYLVK